MTDANLKTLAEIWEEVNRRPVNVVNRYGYPCVLVGVHDGHGWLLEGKSTGQAPSDKKEWKIYTEPKQPKRLWPAIMKLRQGYYVTHEIYDSIESANKGSSGICIRLATAKDFSEGFLIEEE